MFPFGHPCPAPKTMQKTNSSLQAKRIGKRRRIRQTEKTDENQTSARQNPGQNGKDTTTAKKKKKAKRKKERRKGEKTEKRKDDEKKSHRTKEKRRNGKKEEKNKKTTKERKGERKEEKKLKRKLNKPLPSKQPKMKKPFLQKRNNRYPPVNRETAKLMICL